MIPYTPSSDIDTMAKDKSKKKARAEENGEDVAVEEQVNKNKRHRKDKRECLQPLVRAAPLYS